MGSMDVFWKWVRTIMIAIFSFSMLYPFIWMLSASFTQEIHIFDYPFKLIPNPVNLEGYKDVLFRTTVGIPMVVYFWNSIKVTLFGMLGALLSCSMAAYGYSKINFPGRDKIFLLKISTMIIPFQVTMLSNFFIFSFIGILDTHLALILPCFLGSTFLTFMLRQYFVSIPMELSESARVDGAGHIRIYSQIIMPLAKPALATLVIFSFISIWNSYEAPLVYLRSTRLFTLPIALKAMSEDRNVIKFSSLMASSVITALPIIIVYISMQKYFVQGLTTTGLKI
jgi:multiple sugar transport system permease protein